MKSWQYIFWMFLIVFLCSGFRLIGGNKGWDVDNTSTTNSKVFLSVANTTQSITNDLESDDPLFGTSTITAGEAIDSIMNDYNNINSSFVTLVLDSDGDFSTRGEDRTIVIEDGVTGGANGGEAKVLFDTAGNINTCSIVISSEVYSSAKSFIRTMTHEIGHCMGLAHPQETTNSVMSYFSENIRLAIDDKIGISYLYPVNPSALQEVQTFGLTCARKQ